MWKVRIQHYLSPKSLLSVSKSDLKVIVVLAADYGNLGDVAITKAQMTFIKDVLPDYKIVPIYANEFKGALLTLTKIVNSKDIITIIGGGNMGNLYETLEDYRRNIINLFPNNKIISFPQTIDFTSNKEGEVSLQKSIKFYSSHSNLHIFARETQSFEKMKKNFRNNSVYLVPDIVLYLEQIKPQKNRNGVLLCLRNDIEQKISNDKKAKLLEALEVKYKDIRNYDTHIGDENYSKNIADKELDKIWNAFKEAKVVITDRLHGMIFCAITKTPCIVLPNSNHKIAGTYSDWLYNLDYIEFIEKYDEKLIIEIIDKLYRTDIKNSKSLDIKSKYDALTAVLRK